MGAGRIRFKRGPSLMKQVSTKRLSTSRFSSFCVALATADFTTFSISRVDLGLFVNFRVMSASLTLFPRIKSTTNRAFCGDMRINRLVALLTILNLLSARGPIRHRRPVRLHPEHHHQARRRHPAGQRARSLWLFFPPPSDLCTIPLARPPP